MIKIQKRDGRIERFYKEKITWAIFKAAQACGGDDFKKSEELAVQVVEAAMFKYKDTVPSVEQIQDVVDS